MASRKRVKEELIETDDEFRRLYQEHQDNERRLDELNNNPDPSVEDEIVAKGIKVRKLHLKDQMEEKIRASL